MGQFDVMVVGDGIVDAFLILNKPSEYCQYDVASEKFLLHAGAKILVDDSEFKLGGNGSNVSVGLSRLGLHVGLVAELGGDEFATLIQKGLEKENVDLSLVKITPSAQSTFSVGLQVGKERTLFVRHVVRQHDLTFGSSQTKWVYLTSLGKEWRGMYDKTIQFVKDSGSKLAFNPGSQQMKEGYESFKDVVSMCDLLFVNRDEAEEILYGKLRSEEEKETAESLLFRLQRMGPKTIVLTDGENGSYALGEDNTVYSQSIITVEVSASKTGAGDAYASGFLAATFLGKSVQEAMMWGTHNAASVIGKIGAQTGLLTKKDLESKIGSANA